MRIGLAVILACSLLSPALSWADEVKVIEPDEIIARTLQYNLEVKIANIDAEIGAENIRAAKSIYDTVLSAQWSHNKDESQRTSTVFGTSTSTNLYKTSLNQRTPLGSDISVGYWNQKDATNSIFATVNPAYNSTVVFQLRQPLAKNIIGYADRKQIAMIKKEVEALNHEVQARIQTITLQSFFNYWEFYGAYNNVAYEKEALYKARDLYNANQKKSEIGLIEEADLFAFAANLNLRQNAYYEARNQLAKATEQIRKDLNLDIHLALKPAGTLPAVADAPSFNDVMIKATKDRPDYKAIIKSLEARHIQLSMTRNQKWPQLDFVGSLALNGIDTNFSGSNENLDSNNRNWTVGLELNFPLQNRKARSDYKKSVLEEKKLLTQLKNKELEITQQVAQAIKQYKNRLDQKSATLRSKNNQFQKLAGELKKYDQGRSDSDMVIRFQNDYIEAKKLALRSSIDLQLAYLNLLYIEGALIQ